jgi:DNA replication protein DnaC
MSSQQRRVRDDSEGPNIEREVGPEDRFSILRNEVIGDEQLTWEARGMLAFLLSKPPHWRVSVKHLINQTEQARKHLKRDGVHEVLRELIHAGYITRHLAHGDGGTFKGYRYIVSSIKKPPCTENPVTAPCTGLPYTAQPDTANPHLVITKGKKALKREKPPIAPQGGDGRFEDFWSFYPRKVGKDAARRAFAKRNVDAKLLQQMLAALSVQKRSDAWKKDSGQFIPHPSTWLNQGRWQDELPPAGAAADAGGGDYRDENPAAWGMGTAAQRAAQAGMPAWNNVEASMGRMPDFDSYKRQIHQRLTQKHAA